MELEISSGGRREGESERVRKGRNIEEKRWYGKGREKYF